MNTTMTIRSGMRRSVDGLVVLAASFCFFVGSASGTVIVHEPFDYISGDLDAVSGSVWTPVSSAGSNPVQVINGRVTGMDAGSAAMEDIAVPFGATASLLFYGMDVTFTGPSNPTGWAYFAAFRNGVTEVARLFIAAPTGGAANSFRLGNAQNSQGDGAGAVNFFSNLSFGTVYRVVGTYDPAVGSFQIQLYQSGTYLGGLGVLAGTTSGIDSFVLRQGGNASNGYSGLNVDNLTIATTFSEAYAGVPEPGTWAMVALGAGMLALAQWRRRFRQL